MATFSTAQELDEAREFRLPSSTRLVWDNVQGNKQGAPGSKPVIRGIQPRRPVGERLSVVELHPGEWTEFLVPPHEAVRVDDFEDQTILQNVDVWTSNGSGLYRKITSAISDDGRTLIAAPDNSGLSLIHI